MRLLTDATGQPTGDRWQYDAFGNLLQTQGSTPTTHGYTGERWNSDLGLYYLRARWYHQGTGRFLTMDTYPGCNTDPLSLHKYTYAHNDPGNKIDPSGLMAESALQLNAVVLPTKVVVEALGLTVACILSIQATSFMKQSQKQIAACLNCFLMIQRICSDGF
ncbi:MAG: RHS repeat-associated core domain-containing protein [Chloroflexaceae bacterium]|nr:RHS repeat-associated core domain-containing protein [Chloroflexaceae bacterium]